MRKGFTLIELLVVMIILTVIMSMVVPKGSKMLDGFTKRIETTKEKQNLSKQRSMSFIQAKAQTLKMSNGSSYDISEKGVLTKHEKSNDND